MQGLFIRTGYGPRRASSARPFLLLLIFQQQNFHSTLSSLPATAQTLLFSAFTAQYFSPLFRYSVNIFFPATAQTFFFSFCHSENRFFLLPFSFLNIIKTFFFPLLPQCKTCCFIFASAQTNIFHPFD